MIASRDSIKLKGKHEMKCIRNIMTKPQGEKDAGKSPASIQEAAVPNPMQS